MSVFEKVSVQNTESYSLVSAFSPAASVVTKQSATGQFDGSE
jgi:hypothetical protein